MRLLSSARQFNNIHIHMSQCTVVLRFHPFMNQGLPSGLRQCSAFSQTFIVPLEAIEDRFEDRIIMRTATRRFIQKPKRFIEEENCWK